VALLLFQTKILNFKAKKVFALATLVTIGRQADTRVADWHRQVCRRGIAGIIKEATSFDPSSNASLREWGYLGNARDICNSHSIVVYIELLFEKNR